MNAGGMYMKKLFVVIVSIVMVMVSLTMVAGTASAEKKAYRVDLDGTPISPDTWGKLMFKYVEKEDGEGEFTFVFNGHGVTPGKVYHLQSHGIFIKS